MGDRRRVERHGTTLALSYDDEITRIELPDLEEVWVLQIGDSFSGPNEQAILFVEKETFVGVAARTQDLLRLTTDELQRMHRLGKLVCAGITALPRSWRTNRWSPVPSANMNPLRRNRAELETERARWHIWQPTSFEEVFK